MTQKFLHLMASADELRNLSTKLKNAGFHVAPSGRSVGGIHVRVRDDSDDEAEVGRIASAVAPGHQRGPSATPSMYVEGYRES